MNPNLLWSNSFEDFHFPNVVWCRWFIESENFFKVHVYFKLFAEIDYYYYCYSQALTLFGNPAPSLLFQQCMVLGKYRMFDEIWNYNK